MSFINIIIFATEWFFTHKRREQPWVPQFHLSLLTFTWNFFTVCRPRSWKRYVDDVFCIIKKVKEDELLKNINSHRSSIQFASFLQGGCVRK